MGIPKYARFEHERRFLVGNPPDLSSAPVRLIEDVYFSGGQLRLRAITHFDGQTPEFKLCKKYLSQDPVSAPIVNIYLSAEEHAALSRLPGRPLRKRRHHLAHLGRTFAVDVFEGALAGLVLCEAEAGSKRAIRGVEFPPWAWREVTADPFFTGGHLAGATAGELRRRLHV